jgi:hypothetical protein
VALDFGLGVGPYILGSLHSTLTFQNLYVVAACTAVICLILYYLLYGRRAGGQTRMAAQEDTLIDYE